MSIWQIVAQLIRPLGLCVIHYRGTIEYEAGAVIYRKPGKAKWRIEKAARGRISESVIRDFSARMADYEKRCG